MTRVLYVVFTAIDFRFKKLLATCDCIDCDSKLLLYLCVCVCFKLSYCIPFFVCALLFTCYFLFLMIVVILLLQPKVFSRKCEPFLTVFLHSHLLACSVLCIHPYLTMFILGLIEIFDLFYCKIIIKVLKYVIYIFRCIVVFTA
jgi:hypothetical protein